MTVARVAPSNQPSADRVGAIRRYAQALGFDAVGVTRPDTLASEATRLDAFLDQGRHGDMDWMAAKRDRRRDPRTLWPGVRSIIALAVNYGPAADPRLALARSDRGVLSVYAQGDDYHHVLKKRLKMLGRWIAESFDAEVKVFVDTAPVMEKPIAAKAGLGWQGKHTNLVSRAFGSWLFLGEVFTSLELVADDAHDDHCGACRACLDVCPTQAFPAPYQLDARRCISYLTIEHAGVIPRALRPAIGNRIYGCDDCLAVCPWNKFAVRAHETAFHPRLELAAPLLRELVQLDDTGFRAVFRGSPVKRLGRERFVRNVLIAIGNSGDPTLLRYVKPRLADSSILVRGMAVWAARRLATADEVAALRASHAAGETEALVQDEWQ
ncbi:MAG: tRNA epoxyqueuosine(34) reductase QueG [Alphaproteobacteria bacterium]|nr:tRNA epoxyqueuosine(34) reductase QueG [Alphaproteobacteria bacterium]